MSCCGTNTLVVGGRLWEDRPYSCPQHQDTFLFHSNVSAAIFSCTCVDPGRLRCKKAHHEIVLPQSIPSCSITAASIFTTEHGVLLLQNEHRQDIDQDSVRFMRAERQSESESLIYSEKSKNTRTLAKPVEESFQRALKESAGAENAEMVMEMGWTLVGDTRQFTCAMPILPTSNNNWMHLNFDASCYHA